MTLWLNSNQLTGPVDLTRLPRSLTKIYLNENQLSGGVDLTRLPARLTLLGLHVNALSGPVDLTRLPRSLTTLWLQRNAGLTGEWRGDKPDGFDFRGTGITIAGACVIA
jgi:hypothetical protein